MTVEQANVIDVIRADARMGCVYLTIADHLEWDGEHLVMLQEKLNSYLAFVESGEINTAYPPSLNCAVAIDLVLKYRPTAEAEAFLAQVTAIVESAGLTFHYGPLPTGYENDNS
ncbi:MAG: hypothetical protein EKK49_02070 [Rhodocyclaceae bacterium]|nr:MAG: hypothetical protein EKK49_02070 [Rhodocyclaceae bacterium]